MTKKEYTNRVKLSKSNFDAGSNRYKAVAEFKDGEKVEFEFEPKEYVNRFGEECIGNLYLPGVQYYISIKTRVNKNNKIYYSGTIKYEEGRFVNMNKIPTKESVGEYTISFSKNVIDDPEKVAQEQGLPF